MGVPSRGFKCLTESEGVKAWRREGVKAWRREGVKAWRREGVKAWSSEAVKQWSSEAVKQWSSEAVKQWSSEAVKQWSSEAVKQWTTTDFISSVQGKYVQYHFQFIEKKNAVNLNHKKKTSSKNKGCGIHIRKRINLASDIVFQEYGKTSKRKKNKFKLWPVTKVN